MCSLKVQPPPLRTFTQGKEAKLYSHKGLAQMPPSFGSLLCLTLPHPELLFSDALVLTLTHHHLTVFLVCGCVCLIYVCLKPAEGTKHTEKKKKKNEPPELMMSDASVVALQG